MTERGMLARFGKRTIQVLALLAATITAQAGIRIKDGESLAFLGDSITNNGAGNKGYCRLVVHGLRTQGIRVKPIFAGVPGDKSCDMLLRVGDILKQKPDHLFLSVGVNDIWHGENGVPLGHYKILVSKILDRCEAAGTRVILSTITPITEDPDDEKNVAAREYNTFLHSLAKERKLPIARLHEAMFETIRAVNKEPTRKRRRVVTFDGVHLSDRGSEVMARGILKAMGLSKAQLDEVEVAWETAPRLLIIGDRQVTAGARTGGWQAMLVKALNLDGELVVLESLVPKGVIRKSAPLSTILADIDNAMTDQTRHILLVPPLGDPNEETPLEAYRATVRGLAKLAASRECKLIIVTFPVIADAPESDANIALEPYNAVLREVAEETSSPLVDLHARMLAHRAKHPDVPLTIGDERVSQTGSILLAEGVFTAVGGDADRLPALREAWSRMMSYALIHSVNFRVTDEVEKVTQEIRERCGHIGDWHFWRIGMDVLLDGDAAQNEEMLAFVEEHWASTDPDSREISSRKRVSSIHLNDRIDAYKARHEVDRNTFYMRAYLAGLYTLHQKNFLGKNGTAPAP